MKIRFAGTLPLLLSLAGLAAVAAAQNHVIQPPPVKTGLWQSETVTTMTGTIPGRPMSTTAPEKTVQQSCMTAKTWKETIEGRKSQEQGTCTMSNFQQDAHHISYNERCVVPGEYDSQTHLLLLFDSARHVHGTADVKTTGPAMPHGVTMHSTIVSHFVSDSCGDVKPGEDKTLKQ